MSDNLTTELFTAIHQGDLESVRKLIADYPDLLNVYINDQTLLHLAAGYNQREIAEFLLGEGININSTQESNTETALDKSVSANNVEMSLWLIEHGSDVNVGKALIRAAIIGSIAITQLLLDHGAEVNRCVPTPKFAKPMQNALGFALMYGKSDVAALLRKHGAMTIDEMATAGERQVDSEKNNMPHAEILDHLRKHLGELNDACLREVLPSAKVSINIHVVPRSNLDGNLALMTTGMSDLPMKMPTGQEQFQYAELLIYLPPEWPLSAEAMRDPKLFWPIKWLKQLALYPHEHQTFLQGIPPSIIDIGESLAPNLGFTCIMVANAMPPGIEQLKTRDGRVINLYADAFVSRRT